MTTTAQQPIGSGFGPASTAQDVIAGIDLSGHTAIVTGGYSGIGTETTRALAEAGADVVVPTRNTERATKDLETALAVSPGLLDRVEVAELDLMNPASIDRFADDFLASARPLHILVNSAGIMAAPLRRDIRGYESHFSTNHLGHFQLTTRLLPALRRARGARVVSVSAWAHRLSPVVFDDPNFDHRPYEPLHAYAQSKTANILFAVELDRRAQDDGIRAFALHPGGIYTRLSRYASAELLQKTGTLDENGKPVIDPASGRKTPSQSASTSVWCATSPQLAGLGGVYCENNDISPLVGLANDEDAEILDRITETPVGVVPHATDPEAAHRLWKLSEQLLTSPR